MNLKVLNEAEFKKENIAKVMQLYRKLFGKYFGGEFKIIAEESYKKAGEKGTGIRLMNDLNYQLRFNWKFADSNALLKQSKQDKTRLYISSIDYWEPTNLDFEKPSSTVTFLKSINVVQIWKSLAKVIKKGIRGKYTLADLKVEADDLQESKYKEGSFASFLNEAWNLTKDQRADFLMQKAGFGAAKAKYQTSGKEFDRIIANDANLASQLEEYCLELNIGKKETNSTGEKLRKADKELDAQVYSDPELVFQDIEDLATLVAKGKLKSLIVCGQGGVGKCLTNDTRVKTPVGETTMGEIKVGDSVITPKNTIAKVLEVYPQEELKDCYRVKFKDGRYVDCDAEQIFCVGEIKSNRAPFYSNMTLAEIMSKAENRKKGLKNFLIPYSEAIDVNDKKEELPLDPYILGLLIGDGCITQGVGFTNNSIPTIEYFRSYISENFPGYELKFKVNCSNGCDYSVIQSNFSAKGKPKEESKNMFKSILNDLGLFGCNSHTKFIPDIYKYSSIENKLELLKGLMDTDGYIGENGGTQYYTVSEQLAYDFAEIVWSLGGNAKVKKSKVKYKDAYNTVFDIRFTFPFSLGQVAKTNAMKVERYQGRLNGAEFRQHLKFDSIEYIGKKETTCILIDDPDHLYLVNDYLVVHNTFHITKKLKEILGEQPGPWYYHSGMKASPVSFYMKTFEERKGIIVWDEADSLLTNDDIIMMLKPALDTSGDNTMEYSRGASVLGMSKDEIRAVADEIDQQLASGKTLGLMNKNEFVHVPGKFFFEGSMIFISNMPAKKIEGAIMSRSVFVDVYLCARDVQKRIMSIMKVKHKNYTDEQLDEFANALGGFASGPEEPVTYMTPEYARSKKPVTVRSMELAIVMREAGLKNWARLASLYA